MKTHRQNRASVAGRRSRSADWGSAESPRDPATGHRRRAGTAAAARPRGAFTLLEVLLALALFALSVSVLAAAYLNIIQGLESVKTDHGFEQEVRFVREQVMLEPDLKILEKGGETKTLDYGPVRWDVAVQATGVADLFQVQLHVVLGDAQGKQREQTETFQVLRPSWSDPVERDKLRADAKKRIEDDRLHQGVLPAKKK